ncbi:zinc finger, CCHC-type containing protein [Tanacetum coccineum]|uniref:Zinc finger, CCHC-type containing protein n=1 Tax=Tanacetum coccineum TaxID=301880 RepID=A0ABQ5J331_9ASTR
MGKTVNELHAMLKLHEETLPKRDANPALHAIRAGRVQKNQKNKPHKAAKRGHGKGKGKMGCAPNNAPFAPKPKTPPPPKKDNPAKDAVCHQCGEVRHWRRNCPVYLAELMKKKKLSQEASTSGTSVDSERNFHTVSKEGQSVSSHVLRWKATLTLGATQSTIGQNLHKGPVATKVKLGTEKNCPGISPSYEKEEAIARSYTSGTTEEEAETRALSLLRAMVIVQPLKQWKLYHIKLPIGLLLS